MAEQRGIHEDVAALQEQVTQMQTEINAMEARLSDLEQHPITIDESDIWVHITALENIPILQASIQSYYANLASKQELGEAVGEESYALEREQGRGLQHARGRQH